MSDPVQIALVGCGRIARGRHLRILNALENFFVAAVVDPDQNAQASARKLSSRTSIYSELEPVLNTPAIEAVMISSPNHLHAEQALAVLHAKKHLYLEKPIAIKLDDAEELVEQSRKRETVAMIGFNYRFHPMIREARRGVQQNTLGALVAVRSVYSTPTTTLPEWKTIRAAGGGALLDLASHHIDSIRFITGLEVTAVRGWVHSRHNEDDTAALELTFGENLLAQITVATGSIDEDRIELLGETGGMTLDRVADGRAVLRPTTRSGLRSQRAINALRAALPGLPKRNATEVSTTRAFAHFAQAIRGKVNPTPTLQDGLASLRVVLQAEADAKLHRESRN